MYHEYLASEQSSFSTFPDHLSELRWSDGPADGLKKRIATISNHMFIAVLLDRADNAGEHFINNTSSRNAEGRLSKEGLELLLDRWGGLESLFQIREHAQVMKYLVNCIIWYSSTYIFSTGPTYFTQLLCDIELNSQERETVEKIWLGKK